MPLNQLVKQKVGLCLLLVELQSEQVEGANLSLNLMGDIRFGVSNYSNSLLIYLNNNLKIFKIYQRHN